MSVASEKPRPTLDQQRARHAWEAVLRAEERQGDHERQDPKKFGGQAKKLPVRIMASGLGQAIVFLKAKDYAPGLVAEISDWIATRVPLRPDEPRETGPTPRSAGENHPGRLGFSPPRDRRGVGLPAMAPPLCRSGGIDRRRRRMTATVPLPTAIQAVLAGNTHPGLLLDKYVRSWDAEARPGGFSERVQKPTLEDVARLSRSAPPGFEFDALRDRHTHVLTALDALTFHCTTLGPLTLHLARTSALENAGICLHPLYGFVYLPGTGLKGMARAYAETAWLPAQPDEGAAEETIVAVFGNRPGEPKKEGQRSGAVVFYDAWPVAWPKLTADILNNHHTDYYRGEDAPGDWENPEPVYFLAVPPDTTFEFAMAKRRMETPDALLKQAREWLLGDLCHLGAGAKTNAGYGAFKAEKIAAPLLLSPKHAVFETTLRLVTPAFLAGANSRPRTAICARPRCEVCCDGGGGPCTQASWMSIRFGRWNPPSGVIPSEAEPCA